MKGYALGWLMETFLDLHRSTEPKVAVDRYREIHDIIFDRSMIEDEDPQFIDMALATEAVALEEIFMKDLIVAGLL